MNCSHCDSQMEFIEAEPDVGIIASGWFCSKCDEIFEDEDESEDEE